MYFKPLTKKTGHFVWIVSAVMLYSCNAASYDEDLSDSVELIELTDTLYKEVQPIYTKLKNGEAVTSKEVQHFADNVRLRETTFNLLQEFNQTAVFPEEYNTIVSGAESHLVNWLMHPKELNAQPDEIKYLKRVSIDFDNLNHFVHYEVFCYRVDPPNPLSANGWIIGVVGPYFDDSKPYDFPHATFSRLSSTLLTTTPEAEVEWVHNTIALRPR
jgi:hypothetical protein